jgi:Flp pilus assembly protein TadB
MAVHHPVSEIVQKARIVPSPQAAPKLNRGQRVFDIHPGVHMMVMGAWTAFVAILVTTFMGSDLIVPAGICAVGMAGLFLTPALWARVVPDDGLRKQSWAEFMSEGVECITGRLTAGQALAQIMVLPALLLGMAMVFAVIKATL